MYEKVNSLYHLLNSQVKDLQISGIRKISNRIMNDPTIINLTLGQPDFPTPDKIKRAAQQAIMDNKSSYTHNAGMLPLREAISAYIDKLYGLSYRAEDEIIVTNGASEALAITFQTILEPGAEVILPAPIYPGYEPLIRLCGGVPVLIDTRETGFKVNAAMIATAITEKTRCVVLPYPSNPIGCTLNEKEVREIADLLVDKEIFVVSDEIYSRLTYDGNHFSIATILGMKEKSIVINGLSKSHAMTGWRIGFTLAPAPITAEMIKLHLYQTVCASTISQYAALEAVTSCMDDEEAMKAEYRKRRDYVYARLSAMGLACTKPEGAFYAFASIAHLGMLASDFVMKLIDDEKVAVVPGEAFSQFGQGYIRLSYAASMDKLEEGLNRLERFVQKCQRS